MSFHMLCRGVMQIVGMLAVSALASSSYGQLEEPAALEPGRYLLVPQDLVRVTLVGEPDFDEMDRRVDGRGEISLPYIGTIKVGGMAVAEAEGVIRKAYIVGEIFVNPSCSVTVQEYSPKEIMLTGEVVQPGVIFFPVETNFMDIVEALGRAGGIKPSGRFNDVRVTRRGRDGLTQNFSIDLKSTFDGRNGGDAGFRLLPGDVVYVPDRLL